jgi:hypothetical protein
MNTKMIAGMIVQATSIICPSNMRIAVCNSGICIGLNGEIPAGGHVDPNSVVGERLLRKKAQKNEMKKNARLKRTASQLRKSVYSNPSMCLLLRFMICAVEV